MYLTTISTYSQYSRIYNNSQQYATNLDLYRFRIVTSVTSIGDLVSLPVDQSRIHTGFHRFTEIDIFLIKEFFFANYRKQTRIIDTFWRHVLATENIFTKHVTENIDRLALLHIHYNMDIDFDEIIRRFARLHTRRMELENILSD